MFRRTNVASLQRSAVVYSKAAPKAAPQTAAAKAPASPLISTRGALGKEGDSPVDKIVLLAAVSGFFGWWCFTSGPKYQH